MTLPVSQILPSPSFRYVGLMVFFMSILASFCSLGFMSVSHITQGWLQDIQDQIHLEIPSYDTQSKTILSQDQIDSHVKAIETQFRHDPIIIKIDTDQSDAMTLPKGAEEREENDKATIIPSPVFITLHLRPDRAKNAEARLESIITKISDQILIKLPEVWEADIQKTAIIFQFIFGGLTLSVFLVTAIILSIIIKSQIQAHAKTIELIYLTGTSVTHIANLFQSAILRPVIWGCLIGSMISIFSFSPMITILEISPHMTHFHYSLLGIVVIFIILAIMTTRISVQQSLRHLP